MKLIGISASPRKAKNTDKIVQMALDAAVSENNSIETELISLAGLNIAPCSACGFCKEHFYCNNKNDDFNPIMETLKDTSIKGIIFASPVYMGSVTAQGKALLDRSVLFRRNGFYFKDIIGAALTVGGSRNGGQELTIRTIHNAMLIHDMIITGDGSPTAHFGGTGWERVPGGMDSDSDSLDTCRGTGKRVAQLMTRLYG